MSDSSRPRGARDRRGPRLRPFLVNFPSTSRREHFPWPRSSRASFPTATAWRTSGAGIDIYADEPYAPMDLLEPDNTVLRSNVGSSIVETLRAMAALAPHNPINSSAQASSIVQVVNFSSSLL